MSSESLHTTNMMESVALTESHMIVEDDDDDFVMLETDQVMSDMDDDEYDLCDDAPPMRTPSPALSVCSDLPSIDPTLFGLEPPPVETTFAVAEGLQHRRPRVISFGNDEDEASQRPKEAFRGSEDAIDEIIMEGQETPSVGQEMLVKSSWVDASPTEYEVEPPVESIASTEVKAVIAETHPAKSKTGSRLSNKKRRKKMKLLKKATAAQAAAVALAEAKGSPPPATTTTSRSKPKAMKNKARVANIAVACATESLTAYREEVRGRKKGTHNFVSPL